MLSLLEDYTQLSPFSLNLLRYCLMLSVLEDYAQLSPFSLTLLRYRLILSLLETSTELSLFSFSSIDILHYRSVDIDSMDSSDTV